jgi:hypothetical protein
VSNTRWFCSSMGEHWRSIRWIEIGYSPDAPYFIILLCLTPDNFTRQGESAATQWVTNPVFRCGQHCNIVTQYCNIDRLIALANCNRREQIAIFTCWQFVERSCRNVNTKHLIGLFCTSSQSGFIYKLASKSYYELLNFAVDGLILLLYVKNCNLFASVAIC